MCRYSGVASIFLAYLVYEDVWPLSLLALFILISVGFVYCKCKTDARNIAQLFMHVCSYSGVASIYLVYLN